MTWAKAASIWHERLANRRPGGGDQPEQSLTSRNHELFTQIA
ncbi:MAG TPA: hypothetical protein VII38_12605 [Polyangia bacterium]